MKITVIGLFIKNWETKDKALKMDKNLAKKIE